MTDFTDEIINTEEESSGGQVAVEDTDYAVEDLRCSPDGALATLDS